MKRIVLSIFVVCIILCVTGLLLFRNLTVRLGFCLSEQAFKMVAEYVCTNKSLQIEKMNSAMQGAVIQENAVFYIFHTEERKYLYSTGIDSLDAAINEIVKNRGVHSIFYTNDCVVFVKESSYGLYFTSTGYPLKYLVNQVESKYLADNWYLYNEETS